MPHPSITAETYPHKAAIIMGESGEIVTYKQLDERSNQGAQLFRSLGLKSGDHISMMLENNREFLEIVWAAQRSGLIFTPVSTHLKKEETAYILKNCGAKLFIGSLKLAEVAEQVLSEATGVEHFYMVGGIKPGFESWEEATDAQPMTRIDDESNGVPMVYSSGTTGQPKGVFVPPADTDVNTPHPLVGSMGAAFGFSDETVYLSPAPLYHAAPTALQHDGYLPGRYHGNNGAVRAGTGAQAYRGAPGDPQPVGAHYVYPHAEAAPGSARCLRCEFHAVCHPRRRPVPGGDQGENDRVVGAR